jgi:hypothetical protein
MRKMRSDSTWYQLTPEQRLTLEIWLFEENLGYTKTLERVQKEFGVEGTIASLGRYYRCMAQERQIFGLLKAQKAADVLNAMPGTTDALRTAALKLVGKAVMELTGESPEQLEQLASLTRILLESEDNDIRRSRLKLAEKYFHLEATAATIKEFPQLRAYLDALAEDTNLSNEEKTKRMNALLFGGERSTPGVYGPDKSNNGD